MHLIKTLLTDSGKKKNNFILLKFYRSIHQCSALSYGSFISCLIFSIKANYLINIRFVCFKLGRMVNYSVILAHVLHLQCNDRNYSSC